MKEPGELAYPARGDIELVDVLQATGDPVRLQLLRILGLSSRTLPVVPSPRMHCIVRSRDHGWQRLDMGARLLDPSYEPQSGRR